MKILVIGATGFIGRHVIKKLLKTKHSIIVSAKENTSEINFSWLTNVKYIHHLIENSDENLFLKFDCPDILIHLAWEGLPDFKNILHKEKTLYQQYDFLKNLISNGLKNIVITGTCLEYGLKEGCLNEETPTEPVTNYGIAKDTLRKFLQQLKVQYRFNFNWLRLFYMYGQGQHPKSLIPQLEQAILNKQPSFDMSKGDQQRDYLPVEKVAEYIVDIALKQKDFGVVNCCSGKPVTVKSFAEEYLSKKNAKIQLNLGAHPYPDYEPFAFWGDNSKLKKLLYE